MRFGLVALTCAAAIYSSAALAQSQPLPATTTPATTATTPASVASPTDSDPNQIVCKSLPPPTGTRLGSRRICQKLSEWEEQERQHQADLQREQQRGNLFSTPGG